MNPEKNSTIFARRLPNFIQFFMIFFCGRPARRGNARSGWWCCCERAVLQFRKFQFVGVGRSAALSDCRAALHCQNTPPAILKLPTRDPLPRARRHTSRALTAHARDTRRNKQHTDRASPISLSSLAPARAFGVGSRRKRDVKWLADFRREKLQPESSLAPPTSVGHGG